MRPAGQEIDERSSGLARAYELLAGAELLENLEASLASRAVIEQAKGILMAHQHCDPDQAFALLRQASRHRNVKLHDIAAEPDLATAGAPAPADCRIRACGWGGRRR